MNEDFALGFERKKMNSMHLSLSSTTRTLSNFTAKVSAMRVLRSSLVEIYDREQWASALASGGGIYHPGGSLRMAASKREGVVDGDLRVFGIQNLRVISTACFPTGGSANPR